MKKNPLSLAPDNSRSKNNKTMSKTLLGLSLSRMALKFCPVLAFIFSIIVNFTTLYINQYISSLIFLFTSIQVYLNWYSIFKSSLNTMTIRDPVKPSEMITLNMMSCCDQDDDHQESSRIKCWYCDKCCVYTYKPTQHCNACKKCYHYRNHHCFFIGTCILQSNMGNFILICFYTSMACFYSLIIIGPFIYNNYLTEIDNSNVLMIFLNFCFPLAFVKFLMLNHDINRFLLIIYFNILFTTFFLCFFYGIYKFICCLTGKQYYYPYKKQRYDIYAIFGNYGLWNFLFPFNGLLESRCINTKYISKNI